MTADTLTYTLDRILTIEAPRDLVFAFLTDNDRWAAWWGAGSTIDPRPGGAVRIQLPGNVGVAGEVLEITPPARLVFSYGYVSGAPIPAGGSRVAIVLDETTAGTRVHLTHEFSDATSRDHHVQGWRFQLSLFANVVANDLHRDAATLADAWFAAWQEVDETARRQSLERIATADVQFRDRYSRLAGLDDLMPHITASQRFMPGLRLERRGEARHCQGTVLVEWAAVGPDGAERGRGTQVFTLGPDGRIRRATGFWH